MTITTHAALGAVIGHATGNPALAFIISFMAHFILDMIPHGDSHLSDNFRVHKIKQKQIVAYAMVDAVIAILFVLILVNTRDIASLRTFSWGIAGGVLPDLLVGIYDVTKTPTLRWFNKVHFYFHNLLVQRKGDVPLFYAIMAQIIFVLYLQAKI